MFAAMSKLWWMALLMAACGGSSSETPWPVEPIDTDPGPAGEDWRRNNVIDVKKLPDNYNKAAGGSAGVPLDDEQDGEFDEPIDE
jgi:hypothetical protein